MQRNLETTLLIVIGLFAATGVSAQPSAKSPDDSTYQVPDAVVFTALRMSYASRPTFSGGWVSDPERNAVIKAFQDKQLARFLSLSDAWLKKCPVDVTIHLMRAETCLEKRDVSGHFRHRYMYYGLTSSITSSGDGRSKESPFKVISADEEYTVMNHIGARLKSQSLQYPFDVMLVVIDGHDETLYFDITVPMAAEKRALGEK